MKKLLSTISPLIYKTHLKEIGVNNNCKSGCSSPIFKKKALILKKINESNSHT